MAQPPVLTPDGYQRLKDELADLKGRVRRELADALKEAKGHGDLKENAAYHEAKLRMDRLELRIQELEKMLLLAKVVEKRSGQNEAAHVGSEVTLKDLEFDELVDIKLVGSYEADPSKGLISISSPLGQAVIGKKVGDNIEVVAPSGKQTFKVEKVQ